MRDVRLECHKEVPTNWYQNSSLTKCIKYILDNCFFKPASKITGGIPIPAKKSRAT